MGRKLLCRKFDMKCNKRKWRVEAWSLFSYEIWESPKTTNREAAKRKQARIDSGQDIIVGVNQYRLEKKIH
jgi:23S rRNA G2445 N2-methylase RlmL